MKVSPEIMLPTNNEKVGSAMNKTEAKWFVDWSHSET